MDDLFYSRENIKIIVEDENPSIEVQTFNSKVSEDGALIRILFTLTGTRSDLSCLKDLALFSDNIPFHFGYTSIGIVEEVGSRCRFVEKGNTILLPAHYSKYINICTEDYQNMSKVLFKIVPDKIDKVDALFLPALCMSLKLYSNISDAGGTTILLGCNIMGTIFLKLLNYEGIYSVIYLDSPDMKAEFLLENGAETVYVNGNEIPEKIGKGISDAFAFSNSQWIYDIRDKFIPDNVNYVNALHKCTEHEVYPWASYDVLQNALDLLGREALYFRDLIAQHIHSETIEETCNSIKENKYKGKALVYDW